MIIHWQKFHPTIIDAIDDLFDLNFLSQTLTNFQVIEMSFEKLNKSLDETIILNKYKDLKNIFSQSNANLLF